MTPIELLQAENETWRKRARLWKDLARRQRRALTYSKEFTEYWYQAYRRAMKFDEPDIVAGSRPIMGFIYDIGRTLKRMFSFEEHL
jgi:hypothetical protein